MQQVFMCILCLPQVDTHYPNMVKIEIDLFFAHTQTHWTTEPCFQLCRANISDYAAVCIFSDITQ